ncbi:hypothetical protein PUMCH_004314 [Australozyma saopauloensis]|uniref:Uncharacterized protein n=1 Tax=Australozyma saopauloensis TaxID=291208 RepID=A0AAX4HEF6_9ASCO|nr:hypothetical protein PUMCH_004314 [[Candida] saopauloensis]
MFGSKLKRGSLIFLRRNSTVADLVQRLRTESNINVADARSILSSRAFDDQDLKLLHELLKSDVATDIANEILTHGLAHDFSLYHTVSKVPNHKWNDTALASLIQNNPGRAYSLEALAKKHSQGEISTQVRLLLANKLLIGEKSDQGDTEFKPSEQSIIRAIEIINGCKDLQSMEGTLIILFDVLLDQGSLDLFRTIEINGLGEWIFANKLRNLPEESSSTQFLSVAQMVFLESPGLLSKEDYCKILSLEGLDQSFEPFMNEVLEYVELQKMDFDKADANALLIRLQLMETYGINRDAVDIMLEKFHLYQSKEKFGIEFVQTKVVKAFCYQSLKNEDATQLKIAETLVLPEGLPVSTVAELILAKSQFSTELSLEVFNEYIQLVSETVNEVTQRSPKGILTEAVIVSALYNNDRAFAELVYQKAIESKTISNEHEVATVKKVFKVYGEAFVEDSWEIAKPIFKAYVLRKIKELGKTAF